MRHAASFRLAAALAVLGLVLAVLTAALVASRSSTAQQSLDRTLATTSGEKAALVQTELERVRALALVTSRIPPFSEYYANSDSLAARIAAVAGPRREIDNALQYLARLYPSRLVETGYVDHAGIENARVLRGRIVAATRLSTDVRGWPSYTQGASTPPGVVHIGAPFRSPTAGVRVVAATTPVVVDGRARAYVELQLAVTAIRRTLASDIDHRVRIAVLDADGTPVAGLGGALILPHARLRPGLLSVGSRELAVRAVGEKSLSAGPWYVAAEATRPSPLSQLADPTEVTMLALALALLAAAMVSYRWARVRSAAELADEQRARADAERRARVDPLTGLFNRQHALETIEHELSRCARSHTGVGLLVFDVDNFKRINDTHGHTAGDAVLIEVGRRLEAGVREWDVVARVGGEEFWVIAPGMETEDAVAGFGDRLRLAVAERAVATRHSPALPVTVSGGAALARDGDGSVEHAIDRADRALYAAKRRGRNRLCRFAQLDGIDLRAEQPECVRMAEALAVAQDVREAVQDHHSRGVAELAAAIASRLGLSADQVLDARLGGWLHDVGKMAVPDSLLTKPGPLTPAEWEIMRRHPAVGDELLRSFPELSRACRAVRHHHERFDGGGYPDGLAAAEIPVEARIVAAADAYMAMTTDRPYQTARSDEAAIAELRRCSGGHFDPAVVEALVAEVGTRQAGADTASALAE